MLQKPLTEEQALSRLTALCARAEHCRGEMAAKLRQWRIAPEAQERILRLLVEKRFVDDERYTRAFVADKIRYNGWGRRKIEQALRAKGVGEDVYAPLLDEVDDEQYLAVLRPLLDAKWPTIHAATDYERSLKLIRFALSRGFSLEQVNKAIAEMKDNDNPS